MGEMKFKIKLLNIREVSAIPRKTGKEKDKPVMCCDRNKNVLNGTGYVSVIQGLRRYSNRYILSKTFKVIECASNFICLPTEHQGVHKNSCKNVRAFKSRIGIWKC